MACLFSFPVSLLRSFVVVLIPRLTVNVEDALRALVAGRVHRRERPAEKRRKSLGRGEKTIAVSAGCENGTEAVKEKRRGWMEAERWAVEKERAERAERERQRKRNGKRGRWGVRTDL